MQIQPSTQYQVEYLARDLPDDFPVHVFYYVQPDDPITQLHRHNFLEIGLCHSGEGIFIVEDKVLPYSAGDVTIINEKELHLARSRKGTVSNWSYVNCDPVRLLGSLVPTDHEYLMTGPLGGPGFTNVFTHKEYPAIGEMVRQFIREIKDHPPGYRSVTRGLIWALLVKLHRTAGNEQPALAPQAFPVQQVSPALAYLASHYREPVRIPDCAGLCNVSTTHFRRLFKSATGRSPSEYLMHLRIQMASLLLRTTDKPVLDISLEVGYDSLSSFNRNFLKLMEMPPRQWRKT